MGLISAIQNLFGGLGDNSGGGIASLFGKSDQAAAGGGGGGCGCGGAGCSNCA